jgi:hypothetical protein
LTIAQVVRIAVQQVPDVVALSPGRIAMVGTYGPSKMVRGVAVTHGHGRLTLKIHSVAEPDVDDLPTLAGQMRRVAREAVEQLDAGPVGRTDVALDDLRGEDSLS